MGKSRRRKNRKTLQQLKTFFKHLNIEKMKTYKINIE